MKHQKTKSLTPKELIKEVYEIAFGEDAWNEAEELNTSLRELSDADLVDCRQALIDRTNRIMEALNEIGTEE